MLLPPACPRRSTAKLPPTHTCLPCTTAPGRRGRWQTSWRQKRSRGRTASMLRQVSIRGQLAGGASGPGRAQAHIAECRVQSAAARGPRCRVNPCVPGASVPQALGLPTRRCPPSPPPPPGADVLSVNCFACTEWSLGRIGRAHMQRTLIEARAGGCRVLLECGSTRAAGFPQAGVRRKGALGVRPTRSSHPHCIALQSAGGGAPGARGGQRDGFQRASSAGGRCARVWRRSPLACWLEQGRR